MLTASFTSNMTNVIYNLKQIFLQLYTKENINSIIFNLSNKIDSFPILFDQNTYSIHIRIKKSFINKNEHNTLFYYQYLSDIFTNLFMSNIDFIKSTYLQLFGEDGYEYIDYFCSSNYSHLINILIVNETSIVINLI